MSERKICTVCGEDCAGRPRTKDKLGRYFHEECYHRAKAVQRARRDATAAAPAVPALADVDPELLGEVLAEATASDSPPPVTADEDRSVAAGVPCPECGTVMGVKNVICLDCGFNRQTGDKLGVKVERPKRERHAMAGGLTGQLLSPGGVSVLALLFFGVFFAIGMTDVTAAWAYIVTQYSVYTVYFIIVLVLAFRESIVQGLLSFFVPLYVVYFIFGVCGNQYVRMLFFVMLVSVVGSGYLLATAVGESLTALAP